MRQPFGDGGALTVGSTVEGIVIKLAEYGAIVRLQGGRTGLVHISEIADTFVRDVRDYFHEHDRVLVKVLSINNKGRYELSTKHIEQPPKDAAPPPTRERRKPAERPRDVVDLGPDGSNDEPGPGMRLGFEDRLSRFLKDSQERQSDIKRNLETKRGMVRKR